MLLKPLTVAAAGLAVAAQGFLLPPELSESDIDMANSLPIEAYIVPDYMLLNLSCPGCPVMFKGKHGFLKVKTDKASHLELAFSVNHELDHDRLLVNGFELYPSADPFHNVLNAPLLPDPVNGKHKKHRKHPKSFLEPQLGFSLQSRPIAKSKQDELELIALDLQIIEVGTMFVDGIPSVHIEMAKSSSGKLAIGSIETTESQTAESTPMDKQEECTTLLCKWLAIAKDKLSHLKAGMHCGGMMTGAVDGSQSEKHHRPHHHGGEHHHHHRHHRWGLLFKSIAAHILLPIAIGIGAGVAVSLIGMLVGTFIVAVFRIFFRRPGRRHARHAHRKAAGSEAAAAEEKSGLMTNQDPPSYEEEETSKSSV